MGRIWSVSGHTFVVHDKSCYSPQKTSAATQGLPLFAKDEDQFKAYKQVVKKSSIVHCILSAILFAS